jgi:hypothetical protein
MHIAPNDGIARIVLLNVHLFSPVGRPHRF